MSCQPDELTDPWPPPTAHSPQEWRRIFDMTGLPPRAVEYLDPLTHKFCRGRRREKGEPEPWDPNFVSRERARDVDTSDGHHSRDETTTNLGPFAKELADLIRLKRFTSGRTLRGVAMNASMTKFTLSRIERGHRAMTVDELARLAGAFRCPVSDLVESAEAKLR